MLALTLCTARLQKALTLLSAWQSRAQPAVLESRTCLQHIPGRPDPTKYPAVKDVKLHGSRSSTGTAAKAEKIASWQPCVIPSTLLFDCRFINSTSTARARARARI